MAFDRRVLGYALLLSVPVGVGVWLAVLATTRGHPLDPMAVGAGGLTTIALFVLVLAGAAGPEPDVE